MNDFDTEDADPNALSERQQRMRSIEVMIRQTGNCDLLMELDRMCLIADDQERFAALIRLRERAIKR